MIQHVTAKLGNMRKAVDWIVYPGNHGGDGLIFVQSDKRACSINLATKKGMLSNGKGHPGFISTSRMMGAIEIDVPQKFIDDCLAAQPKKGDTVGKNCVIIG